MPYFNRMHEMTVEHTHEEIQLLAIDFSTMLFETTAPMPTWRDAYLARDQRPSLRLPAPRPPGAPVAARRDPLGPQVTPAPRAVPRRSSTTFPDATFVVTHRDPVSVTTSMVTMLAYTARLTRDRVDLELASGHYWADRLERMLRRCADERDVLPADQTIDVHFDEFMADDLAMVRAGLRPGRPAASTNAPEAAMAAFMAEHPRGRHGAVATTSPSSASTPASAARRCRFYTDRFGVTPRVLARSLVPADPSPAARHVHDEVARAARGRRARATRCRGTGSRPSEGGGSPGCPIAGRRSPRRAR